MSLPPDLHEPTGSASILRASNRPAQDGRTPAATIDSAGALRVGITTTVLDAHTSGGHLDGIGVYTSRLLEGLSEVAGIATIGVRRPSLRRPFPERGPGPGFALPWPVAAMIAASGIVGGFPGARAVERAVDLLHVTDYHVARLPRTPVVATLYDAIPLRQPEFASRRLRSLKNHLLVRAAAWADLVLAISQAAVPELVEHFRIAESRIRVIPLGIEPEWLQEPSAPAIEAALAAHRLQPGYLLFVGTLQPRKNLGRLLAAHRTLSPAARRAHPLVVIGKYGWNSEEELAALRADEASGACRWLGYVARDEMRCLFAAAAGFVFPSLAEGFGLPLLEAMAAGTPAAASDLPVMREIGAADVLYFDPFSGPAIAETLRALIDSGGDVRERTARARERARSMTWGRCVQATADVYRELAGGRANRPD